MTQLLPQSVVSELMHIPLEESDRKDWSVRTFHDIAPGDVMIVSCGEGAEQSIVKLSLIFRGDGAEAMCFTMIDSQDSYSLQTVEEALESVENCSLVLLRRQEADSSIRHKFEALHKSPQNEFVRLFLSVVGVSLQSLSGKRGSPCLLLLDALLGAGYVAGPPVRKVAELPPLPATPVSLTDLFSEELFAAPSKPEFSKPESVIDSISVLATTTTTPPPPVAEEAVAPAQPVTPPNAAPAEIVTNKTAAADSDNAPLKGKAQISSTLPTLLNRLESHMEKSSQKIAEQSASQGQKIAQTAAELTAKLQVKVCESLAQLAEKSQTASAGVNASIDAVLAELQHNDEQYILQLNQRLIEYKEQLEELNADAIGDLEAELASLAEKVREIQNAASESLSKICSNSSSSLNTTTATDYSRSDSQLCIDQLCQTFKDTLQTKISRYTGYLASVTGQEIAELEQLLQEVKDETVLQESAMKSTLDFLIMTHSRRATGQKLSEMKVALRSLHGELVEEFSQSNEELSSELAIPLRELAASCRRELESEESKLSSKAEVFRADLGAEVDSALEKVNDSCTENLKKIRARYAACLASMEGRSAEISRLAGSSALSELLEGHSPADYLSEKLRRCADTNFDAFITESDNRLATVAQLAQVLCAQAKNECQLQLDQTESKARTVVTNIRKRLSLAVTQINQAQASCLVNIDPPS